MATLPSLLFALLKGKPLPLLRGQLRRRQEVRAPPRREKQVLPPPPLRHLLVVPRKQHLRHRPVAELRWPRVVRRLQEATRERFLCRRPRRAEGAARRGDPRVRWAGRATTAPAAAKPTSGFISTPGPPP